jgi:hypothetical protein
MTKKTWDKLVMFNVITTYHPFMSGGPVSLYACNKNEVNFRIASMQHYGKMWGVVIGNTEEIYVNSQEAAMELIISSVDVKTITGYRNT